MATGVVAFVSDNQGMLVISHDDGHTVVELLGDEGEIQRGDVVTGDWSSNGGETLLKEGERYDAYFQGTWPTLAAAVKTAKQTVGG